MKNIKELTGVLSEAIEKVSVDRDYVAQAQEVANLSGKLINAQKIRMEYSSMRNEKPSIEFMEVSE
jgi:hypothetical protein